jgi:hypothetical protein
MGRSTPFVRFKKVVDGRLRGHDGMLEGPVAQRSKSFLVLFFKKEPVSFF